MKSTAETMWKIIGDNTQLCLNPVLTSKGLVSVLLWLTLQVESLKRCWMMLLNFCRIPSWCISFRMASLSPHCWRSSQNQQILLKEKTAILWTALSWAEGGKVIYTLGLQQWIDKIDHLIIKTVGNKFRYQFVVSRDCWVTHCVEELFTFADKVEQSKAERMV